MQFKISYPLGILWPRPVHTRRQRRWMIGLRKGWKRGGGGTGWIAATCSSKNRRPTYFFEGLRNIWAVVKSGPNTVVAGVHWRIISMEPNHLRYCFGAQPHLVCFRHEAKWVNWEANWGLLFVMTLSACPWYTNCADDRLCSQITTFTFQR